MFCDKEETPESRQTYRSHRRALSLRVQSKWGILYPSLVHSVVGGAGGGARGVGVGVGQAEGRRPPLLGMTAVRFQMLTVGQARL